jgi:hypothetical protein
MQEGRSPIGVIVLVDKNGVRVKRVLKVRYVFFCME